MLRRCTHPTGSVTIPPAREAVLEAVGHLGDPTHEAVGVQRLDGVGGQVADDDEVFLAAEDLDREVALDAPRVELEQDACVAVARRAADRDEAEDRPSFGVGPRVADVDRLLPAELQGDDHPPAVTGRARLEAGTDDQLAHQAERIGIGRLGGLVGPERIAPRPGIGLGGAEREPTFHTEAFRRMVTLRAPGADQVGNRHRARLSSGPSGITRGWRAASTTCELRRYFKTLGGVRSYRQ